MRFLIISHVEHTKIDNNYFGYSPYINEMNIWISNFSEVAIVAPLKHKKTNITNIESSYNHNNISFAEVPSINITNFIEIFFTLLNVPKIIYNLFIECYKADHIHLRCPGNIGLLGVFVQIFFPSKKKTAKYAGNWDLKSKQPISYKFQKWILNNTFLTKNMQVLVYGEWENSSKNIKPFFTATYSDSKKEKLSPRCLNKKIIFIFVGTLSIGKRPLYAIQIIENLSKLGINVQLNIYGDGVLKNELQQYIISNNLSNFVFLHGNQNADCIENSYKESHFLILASKSEGWPKVVAEAMFWSCLPLTTNVSCVNYMIDFEKRGKLLSLQLENDTQLILHLLKNEKKYQEMCLDAANWSQKYTTDLFENEIKKLVL